MSDHDSKDDDLLAGAIPIDSMMDEEEDVLELSDDDDVIELSDDDVEAAPKPPPPPVKPELPTEIDLVESDDDSAPREIRTFESNKKKKAEWKRQPNRDGTGATHVRTFVSKLRLDAIENLDEQINTWLDEHPELEVKFVTMTTGELRGKIIEPAMFMNVWV